MSIEKLGDSQWGSHCTSPLNTLAMFSPIMDVLEDIEKDGTYQDQNCKSTSSLRTIRVI